MSEATRRAIEAVWRIESAKVIACVRDVSWVVDSIENEPAMHAGARIFGERVARAYADPRSRLHLDDARTFFSTGARRYDVIVSEPSNPWVGGTASLFSDEFYAFVPGQLNDGGLFD